MARQVIEKLIDDIDGSEANQTVEFALDGIRYTIDLSEKNAGKLRDLLASYVANGTRIGRTGGITRPGLTAGVRRGGVQDNKAIREWAKTAGLELADRGRISQDIVAKYNAANGR